MGSRAEELIAQLEAEIAQRDARIAELESQSGEGTSSNKYRAELYDEVWQAARDMGYSNVIGALQELAALKAQQPSAGVVDERAAFEGAWPSISAELPSHQCNQYADGEIECAEKEAAFEGWQARACFNPCRAQAVPADHSAQNLNMVPDGYKVVPVEPTQEMLKAAWDQHICSDGDSLAVYRAMLVAAPPGLGYLHADIDAALQANP